MPKFCACKFKLLSLPIQLYSIHNSNRLVLKLFYQIFHQSDEARSLFAPPSSHWRVEFQLNSHYFTMFQQAIPVKTQKKLVVAKKLESLSQYILEHLSMGYINLFRLIRNTSVTAEITWSQRKAKQIPHIHKTTQHYSLNLRNRMPS